MPQPPKRTHPAKHHFLTAMFLTIITSFAIWYFAFPRRALVAWLGCWLVGINVVTFLYYGYDKRKAQRQGRRVPEIVLHGMAALGGSCAAYLAMRYFRHKTIKGKFRILFWCIVVLQLVVVGWIIYQVWWT